MIRRRYLLTAWLIGLALVGCGPQAADPAGPTVVYLVRHAEKAGLPAGDPDLTPAGVARARALAEMLADVPLAGDFSSDYRRTRLTAAPTAAAHGLPVTLYGADPEGLRAFAARVARQPGHHLVVGHSNTTPALVELLGGDPLGAIDDDEYDRLYAVTIMPDGAVSSFLLRYPGQFGVEPEE